MPIFINIQLWTGTNYIPIKYVSNFYKIGQKGYNLEKGELWKHSVATALVSMMDDIGIGADCLAYKIYDEIFDNLGVSEDDTKPLMTEYHFGLWKAEKLLNVK